MIDMERSVDYCAVSPPIFNLPQEGLKAREGGAGHANPFDIFSNFFGGGRKYPYCACKYSS